MHANLFLEGKYHRLYSLTAKGASEVDDLLFGEHSSKQKEKVVATFLSRLEYAVENRIANLPIEWRDCWQEAKPKGQFCEFKSGKYRISFFYHPDRRVLLATHFTKRQKKEKKQYARAIRLNDAFSKGPVWEDPKGGMKNGTVQREISSTSERDTR